MSVVLVVAVDSPVLPVAVIIIWLNMTLLETGKFTFVVKNFEWTQINRLRVKSHVKPRRKEEQLLQLLDVALLSGPTCNKFGSLLENLVRFPGRLSGKKLFLYKKLFLCVVLHERETLT